MPDGERPWVSSRSRTWIGVIEMVAAFVVAIAVVAFIVWLLFFARHPLLSTARPHP